MTDCKITIDVAESEFERFCENACFDFDVDSMDEEDAIDFKKIKSRLARAISTGSLVIDSEGTAKYTPVRSSDKTTITFYEPTGADIACADKLKKGHDTARMYTTMGAMTRTSSTIFAKMFMTDLKICRDIATLFLVD